jgi:hypothetical protein
MLVDVCVCFIAYIIYSMYLENKIHILHIRDIELDHSLFAVEYIPKRLLVV